MKQIFIATLCMLIGALGYAQQIVPITSFEDPAATPFTGGQATFSIIDKVNPSDNVAPYDGEWHCAVEYDTNLGSWSWSELDFVEPVDLTGMRILHLWVYFTEQAEPDGDVWELRLRIEGAVEADLGYKSKPVDDTTTGKWIEYTWELDSYLSQNELSAVTGIDVSFMPGSSDLQGLCYIDNIYASRPADFPDQLELVTIYSLDEEDDSGAPAGWTSAGGNVFLGFGDVEPTEGTNYMEIYTAGGWAQIARTTDAKGASDLWSKATDIYMDVMLSETFTGGWLLLNPVFQSGGNDAEGNALAPVNGWDSYGERDIRWGGHLGVWKTIAWPFRKELHMGALENDGGWFQMILVTNNDASMVDYPIYIDNIRLAIPSTTTVQEWNLY